MMPGHREAGAALDSRLGPFEEAIGKRRHRAAPVAPNMVVMSPGQLVMHTAVPKRHLADHTAGLQPGHSAEDRRVVRS